MAFQRHRSPILLLQAQEHTYPEVNWIDLIFKGAKLNKMNFDDNAKLLSLGITTDVSNEPYLQIQLPNALFGSIFDLKSFSEYIGDQGGLVKQFKISQQFRTVHTGETTIFEELNPSNRGEISVTGA